MFIGDSRQTADSIILSKLDQTHKGAYRLIGCSRYLMVMMVFVKYCQAKI